MTWRRIFEAEVVTHQAARGENLPLPALGAIFEEGLTGRVAAAVERDIAARRVGRRARDNVDKPRRAQPILRRQRAGDERQRADEARVHDLREAGHAVGQQDAIDPILQIGVLVADMQAAARRRILRDARGLQQHLVERRLIALRKRLYRRAVERILADPDLRQQTIEPLGVCQRRRRRRGRRRRRAGDRRHSALTGLRRGMTRRRRRRARRLRRSTSGLLARLLRQLNVRKRILSGGVALRQRRQNRRKESERSSGQPSAHWVVHSRRSGDVMLYYNVNYGENAAR